MKHKKIIIICMVSMCLSAVFFYVTESSRVDVIPNESVETWTILPDTIQVDGDFAKARAKNKGKNYLLHYKLETKEQQAYLLSLTKPLVIKSNQEKVIPQAKRNLNGFDYADYLKSKQLVSVYKLTTIYEVTESTLTFFRPLEWLSSYRARIHLMIDDTFLPYTAFYMSSLLLGINDSDNREVWNKLSLAHLFALSGIHVTFLVGIIQLILLRIGLTKEATSVIELLFLLFFIGMTGYSIGVVRASVQHLLKKGNSHYRWQLSSLDCWSMTLVVHSLFMPTVLFNIGGQLSYYLSFLIIFIYPIIKGMKRLPQTIVFQLLLTFFSLPLLCYYFFEFNVLSSLYSLIFTPILFQLILPLLSLALIVSFWLPDVLIYLIERVIASVHLFAEWCQGFTLFQVTTGSFPVYVLIVLLVLQLVFLIHLEKIKTFSKIHLLFLVCSPSLFIGMKYLNPFGMIAFVDVGQGDALFIQLPFHQGNYLVDTGGSLSFQKEEWKEKKKSKAQADYTLIPFLKSRGVSTLDGVFLTHAHEDHFGDIDRLSSEIQIKQVLMTPGTYQQPNVQQKMILIDTIELMTSKTKLSLPSIAIQPLYPNGQGDGQNDDSLVLKVTIHQKTFLLMGDLEKDGEKKLLQQYPNGELKADCLKIGHHGSKTSSHLAFIKEVAPSQAVISLGENNRFNHPSEETLETLNNENISIFRTDEQGMIYQKWLPFKKDMLKIRSVK
ncbi:DNA internalization-related competence protein ComEC/Rec2 [Vagococcus sp. JNUCC 83]